MLDGKTLRNRRQRLELSQQALARMIGMRAETISRYENDHETIPLRTELAIKRVLEEQEAS